MWLRLLQYGSVLEAYDSAGLAWSGSISMLAGGAAQLQLRGRTTAGADARIAGTLRYADGNSTLDAAWIEPAFSGSLFATATVAPATASGGSDGGDDGNDNGDGDNDGGGGDDGGDDGDDGNPSALYINPEIRRFESVPNAAPFTAVGGTEPYNWSVSDESLGTISPTTGVTVTYTRTDLSGDNTITVIDADGSTATATASY